MTFVDPKTLPYRPCAGIVLLNRDRHIWIGRRFEELVLQEEIHRWQMPQGGIDDAEDPRLAALRELYEETGVRSVEVLAETRSWVVYDLPAEAVGTALRGKYRGQRQKWFAMLFTGDESEIDLAPHGQTPEFDSWRWASADEVVAGVVPFKRQAYEAVLGEFRHLLTLPTPDLAP